MLRRCLGGKGMLKTCLGTSGLFFVQWNFFLLQNQCCDSWLSYARKSEEMTQYLLGYIVNTVTGWILKSSCRRATHLVHGTTCNWNPLSKSNFLQNFNSPLLYRVYYHLHGGIIGRGWMKEKQTEALQSPIDSKQVQHLWGKQMSPQLIGLGMDSGQSWPAQPTEA